MKRDKIKKAVPQGHSFCINDLFLRTMICRNNVYARAADVFDKHIADNNGGFYLNCRYFFHAVKNFIFGQRACRFAGHDIVHAAIHFNGGGKASDGVCAFASCVCVASFAGVARDGNNLALVVKLNRYAAAHGAGHANNIFLHT